MKDHFYDNYNHWKARGRFIYSKPPKRGPVQAKCKFYTSWLHGVYPNGEIHTGSGYVSVTDGDYFFQGESGEKVIDEIAAIWERNPEMTNEDAFNHWINTML